MKLTKKEQNVIMQVYEAWMKSYLSGDVKTYDSFLDDDYRFIGSTNNEEFLNKNDTTNFFEATADQLAGKTEIRNSEKTIEQVDGLVFITDLFDAYFLDGDDWAYYGRFRFTSAMRKNKNGWRFMYQHFSTPDSKAQEGETLGTEQITKENLELREAVKRRTVELEQKNRELEVEGALDRIRAEAVAMQQSSDLLDIVVTIRNEFIKLDHEAHYFWHMMWLPEKYEKAMTSGDGTKIGFVMQLPRHIHGDIPLLAKWEKSKKATVVYAMDADAAIAYVDKMVKLGDFQNIDPQAPSHDDIKHIGGLTFIMARTSHGEIGYSLPGVVKNPPKEDIDILVKFAGAFDLAHQRFLDLQKSEKQTRETQIELALEKVRSRTMGMQRSDELRDTAMLLFQQAEELGINSFACGFNIWDEDKKYATAWMASKDRLQPPFKTNSSEDVYLLFREAEKRGESLFVLEQKGKELEDHYKYLVSIPEVKALAKAGLSFPTFQIIHCAYFSKGYLMFITHEPVPGEHDIFKRFAKVFEQTYTRFLDLQKAEAQARESEIELALERVRARSMAMQKSEELKEVIKIVYQQLTHLKINLDHSGFVVDYTPRGDWNFWIADKQDIPSKITHPYFESVWANQFNEAKEKGADFFATNLNFEEKNKFYNKLLSLIPGLPKASKDFYLSCPGLAASTVLLDNVGLYIENFEGIPYTEEENDILMRFGKVFQQTYTRFLDLKKAEAQAREAQIEAALERVRSRSMAMHNSDELREAGELLFNEITKLGIESITSGYVLMGEDEKIGWNYMPNPSTGKIVPEAIGVYHDKTDIMRTITKNWKKQKPLFVVEMNEEQTITHQTFIADQSINFHITAEQLIDVSPPELKLHNFNFKQGYLLIVGGTRLTSEQEEMMLRFSKVFQQTYTRFLDLQKAEAQAREAQIEVAMERIRSRAIAMRTSDELLEVAIEIRRQTDLLGQQDLEVSAVHLYEKDAMFFESIAAVRTAGNDGEIITIQTKIPVNAIREIKQMIKNYWSGLSDYTIELNQKRREKWQKVLKQYVPEISNQRLQFSENEIEADKKEYWHFADFSGGSILSVTYSPPSPETKELFRRSADVFDLAYRRYMDLQKAEAQAREAQIETSLERVRSRSMAMHSSDELTEAGALLYSELTKLGIENLATGYSLFDEDEKMGWNYGVNPKDGSIRHKPVGMLHTKNKVMKSIKASWKKQQPLLVLQLNPEETIKHQTFIAEESINFPISKKDLLAVSPKRLVVHTFNFKQGYLLIVGGTLLTTAQQGMVVRFAKVFQQTYTRFLDLQKAEAQARESEIELALERVRAKTMAMQHSDELAETASLLFKQISDLGIETWTSGFNIWEKDGNSFIGYNPTPEGGITPPYHIPSKQDVFFKTIHKATKNKNNFLIFESSGKSLSNTYKYMKTLPVVKDVLQGIETAGFELPKSQVNYCAYFNHGFLLFITLEKLPDAHDIFKRFGKVFQQTYTRFLDLQRAEAQAREAQIEVALERTRTQSMLMQHSDELNVTAQVFHQQLQLLGIDSEFSYLWLPDETEKSHMFWATWSETQKGETLFNNKTVSYPLDKTEPAIAACYTAWESGETTHVNTVKPDEVKDYFATWDELLRGVNKFKPKLFPDGLYYVDAYMKYGCFGIMAKQLLTKDEEHILSRFSKEFERTYTRFLDLQKAEAQAREAQIETALEKVRSRSLAMHKPDELQEVVTVVAEKLKELGVILDAGGVIICTYFPDNKDVMHWISAPDFSHSGSYFVPYFDDRTFNEAWDSKNSGESYFSKAYPQEEKNKFFEYAFEHSDYRNFPDEFKQLILQSTEYALSFAWQKNSAILIPSHSGIVPSESDAEIMKRFAKVFEQAYIRFMDLQKAEAQAREAKIEAALERVRSRSMAMHKSDELLEVINVVSEQLQHLDMKFSNASFGINTGSFDFDFWVAAPGIDHPFRIHLPYLDSPVFNRLKDAQINEQSFFADSFNEIETREWMQHLFANNDIAEFTPQTREYLLSKTGFVRSSVLLRNIILSIINYEGILYSNYENDVFIRFANAFEQAYTRFLDLQKAEAQAKEAIKQASLDRVRGEIASMRSTEDLQRITPLVFNELTTLGIPFIRCGVFIIQEKEKKIDVHLSAPDGHSLGVLHLPVNVNLLTQNAVKNWKSKKVYHQHWNKEDFANWTQSMLAKGQIKDVATYQGAATPPDSLDLHFIPFTQGMLYVGSTKPLDEEEIVLADSLAKAFAIAYARYEDFVKLEKAKQSIENTLTELKVTQNQLIQAEKMASLGELTAGIAHEIQNPLNFVNNFSEVSNELIDEMNEEIEKGDLEEAKFIASDIKQNLEKINHHGKRADAIVKGMLQHSRSSSGYKEPTDINALADEYLRLAYHGLRAKDKSFNATMNTDFDESIGKIEVVSQDIGRVILNLITNAFYVVTEKKGKLIEGYKPTVSISTKRKGNQVLISVKDNGNGIPQKVLDKIFQPFFTTKPTGQGTGLGLSLSYDIIKAHGGELKVETEEGEGTTFSVVLPIAGSAN